MTLLKFITCGSVDDGKSTLIGRLLYDSKSILADQLEAIEKSTKNKDNGEIDLALLTDGLRAEREQGITIDVAYRYFSTDKRKFIIADAPGHIQYTRNMITGASNVDLAIVLIDARNGVVEQTKRHSIIASLLGIPKIVVAINKIDLVNYSEEVYNQIVKEYEQIAKQLGIKEVVYIPVSALTGANIVDKSDKTPWYKGEPLLDYLENVNIDHDLSHEKSRFQVQYVLRPQTDELHDYRGYAGKVQSGYYQKGDKIKILPSGIETEIEKIEFAGEEIEKAIANQSVMILLKDDIDVSRGDSFIKVHEDITETTEPEVLLCWLDDKPLIASNTYVLQHGTKKVRTKIKDLINKLDVNTLEVNNQVNEVKLNEIVKARLKTNNPLAIDAYKNNKYNGAAILIDETSHNTVAAVLFSN